MEINRVDGGTKFDFHTALYPQKKYITWSFSMTGESGPDKKLIGSRRCRAPRQRDSLRARVACAWAYLAAFKISDANLTIEWLKQRKA